MYTKVPTSLNFVDREKEILQFWKENRIFEKSCELRKGRPAYTFYDGPPTANGKPHIGHILTRAMKDIIPRYRTMKGYDVLRKAGWDTHGLPVELEVEKMLGLDGKKQIEAYGVEPFIAKCKESVWKYKTEWEQMSDRVGYWADMEHPYVTYEDNYIESEWWALKTIYEKGLLYKGHKVVPYCPRCGTALASHEVAQGYKDVKEISATVRFKCTDEDASYLAWTTTPWTLPSNLMLAVGNDISYAVMEEDGQKYVLAEALLGRYKQQLAKAERVGTLKGSELVGLSYEPMFPYFKHLKEKGAFRVLAGEFVSTEDGTGVVHIAPGFGQDDFEACRAYDENFPVVCPVDEAGKFTAEVSDYAGKQVFEANEPVMQWLKQNGLLVKKEQYTHSYPFCWRTDTPLIYKAMSSWFVKVTDFRDEMVRLNQEINWVPEHIKDGRFGKWLEGARDWSISRNRFWGTPIPVWKSDDPKYPHVDVFGSIAEIREKTGIEVTDLHKPYIDEVVYPNPADPTGKSMMRRVSDVFDCWFESGSMPYAQVHYPFDNKEWFENHFPADFIVEAMDQTRGWFYTLTVLSTALHHKPAFKNCICTGLLMAEGGQKLSKRLKNYPDPAMVLDKIGSDTLRWFLVSSPVLKGGNLAVDQEGKEIVKAARVAQIPFWNAFYFFTLYANAEGYKAKEVSTSDESLDNYILSKLKKLSAEVKKGLDTYDVAHSCSEIAAFMEVLNNWYIRRTRDRFWTGDNQAFDVLYTVLVNLCKIMAPLMPFTTEYVYQALVDAEASVHLTDYPLLEDVAADDELVRQMDFVQELCSAGKFVREEKNLRNRLPLNKLTVAGSGLDFLNDRYKDIIKDELNVRQVDVDADVGAYAAQSLYLYTPLLGKKLGKDMGRVMAAYNEYKKTGVSCWADGDGGISVAGIFLTPDLYEERLEILGGKAGKAFADNKAVVVLDTEVTEELVKEGMARDFVRLVQNLRKEKNFDISDRIRLCWQTDDEKLRQALRENEEYIKVQVLVPEGDKVSETCAGGTTAEIEGASVRFDAEVVSSLKKGA